MVKQGTVLVVDDNKGILKALGLLLDKYFDKVILISSPNRIAGKKKPPEQHVPVVLLCITARWSLSVRPFWPGA